MVIPKPEARRWRLTEEFFTVLLTVAAVVIPVPSLAQEVSLRVTDYEHGRPIQNAHVLLLDAEMEFLAEARSNEDGRWSFERTLLSGDTAYVSVSAPEYVNWLSPPLTRDGNSADLEARLVGFEAVGQAQAELHPELERSGVFGRVIDATTSDPISGARVVLGEGREALTTKSGFFVLDSILPGLNVIRVEHLAYETREAAIRLGGGHAAQLEIELTAAPLELDPIEVTVKSTRRLRDMRGFERRKETHFGHFYTRDYIKARGPRYLGNLLGDVPGIQVARDGPIGPFKVFARRRPCNVKVWVDGIERFGAWGPIELESLLGIHLEAVEIYKGLETPAEFYDPAVRPCVTVIVWTSRPGG